MVPAGDAKGAALARMIDADPNAHLPGARRLACRARAAATGLGLDAAPIAEIEAV